MLVSILTSSYNCAKYLNDCIQSVFKQTYTNWEMIIVNDGSKDNTIDRLNKYTDNRIVVINNSKNKGCGASYNIALSAAKGDICCVLDADDALSSKESLSKVVEKYNEHPEIEYIWTQFWVCDAKLKKMRRGHCKCPGNQSFLHCDITNSEFRHCFSHWRTFRTHLRYKALIFNPELPAAVDKWMGYKLEELGIGGFFTKKLYLYRRREGGLTYKGKPYWKRFMKEFEINRKKNATKIYEKVKL